MNSKCNFYCYRNIRKPSKNYFENLQPKKLKLVLFDMDGVITDTVSSWRYIHNYFQTSNDRSVDEYLKGNIDDLEFIKRDVSLWKENGKAITQDRLMEILQDVPVMKGAAECIDVLAEHGVETAIVSAGLKILAERIAKKIGIKHVYANDLKTDKKGFLTGEGILGVKLMYKDEAVENILYKLRIPYESCAAVGNSCFDIPMFEICSLSIAFNPHDNCVKEAADFVIEEKDLSKILPVLNPYLA